MKLSIELSIKNIVSEHYLFIIFFIVDLLAISNYVLFKNNQNKYRIDSNNSYDNIYKFDYISKMKNMQFYGG